MTDRYTVTHSPFGFESDVGSARLKYAVTDNRPDKITVYRAIDRDRTAMTGPEAAAYLQRPVAMPPFRHIAYATCKEDAAALVLAMNDAENGRIDVQVIRARQQRDAPDFA